MCEEALWKAGLCEAMAAPSLFTVFVVTRPRAICHPIGASSYSRAHSPICSLIHQIES